MNARKPNMTIQDLKDQLQQQIFYQKTLKRTESNIECEEKWLEHWQLQLEITNGADKKRKLQQIISCIERWLNPESSRQIVFPD